MVAHPTSRFPFHPAPTPRVPRPYHCMMLDPPPPLEGQLVFSVKPTGFWHSSSPSSLPAGEVTIFFIDGIACMYVYMYIYGVYRMQVCSFSLLGSSSALFCLHLPFTHLLWICSAETESAEVANGFRGALRSFLSFPPRTERSVLQSNWASGYHPGRDCAWP